MSMKAKLGQPLQKPMPLRKPAPLQKSAPLQKPLQKTMQDLISAHAPATPQKS